MFGGNSVKSAKSITKAKLKGNGNKMLAGAPSGYGGHFRAVQGFKYIG
jgi:hypothetical protein